MPIPYADVDENDALGSAAFLKIERSSNGACCLGALFVVNARGEPLEFAYNRVRVPNVSLWRQTHLHRYTQRRLATSLFSVCSHQPRLLVCLASEVSHELFARDVQVDLPVARIGHAVPLPRCVDTATGEVLAETDARAEVTWQPAPPVSDSVERRLFDHLVAHGLLLEPLERATVGLREVYGDQRTRPA